MNTGGCRGQGLKTCRTRSLVLFSLILGTGAIRAADPPVRKGDDVAIGYWGTVTAVTKDSITIQYKDWKPRTFPVSDVLARGDFQMSPRPHPRTYQPSVPEMYPLTAVKVGDWVNILYAQVDGKVICDHTKITKRPGGKVPPLPKEAEDLRRSSTDYIPYHEQMDAYWNLLDNGIPYPEKFGVGRKFPIAPPPRPIKRIGS